MAAVVVVVVVIVLRGFVGFFWLVLFLEKGLCQSNKNPYWMRHMNTFCSIIKGLPCQTPTNIIKSRFHEMIYPTDTLPMYCSFPIPIYLLKIQTLSSEQ